MARSRRARQVIVVQRSKARCELARRFDVDAIIYSETEDVAARVRELTGDRLLGLPVARFYRSIPSELLPRFLRWRLQ